jgi:hypothetical protein
MANLETVSRAANRCYTMSMTVLEKFRQFAESLPTDRLNSVELALAEIMESYSDRFGFSESELWTIDQRVGEPNAQFSNSNDIAELFGNNFTA